MREKFGGTEWNFEDEITSEPYESLWNKDIDVSCDGKKWFHALGPRCLEDLPQYVTPARKKEGKTDAGAS
jgi:hypothetical protein